MGLRCMLSPPLECVSCGGGKVVILHGLKLSTMCTGSGPPRRCRPRSATNCALPGAIWHQLQSDLPMAATYAGLGGAQVKPRCEPRLAAASAKSGAT